MEKNIITVIAVGAVAYLAYNQFFKKKSAKPKNPSQSEAIEEEAIIEEEGEPAMEYRNATGVKKTSSVDGWDSDTVSVGI